MDIAIVCSNCNYHSRVAAVTVAQNRLYCQNCGKQIEVALPRRDNDAASHGPNRGAGAHRKPTHRPAGARPAPKRR